MPDDFRETTRNLSVAKAGDADALAQLLERYDESLLGAIRGMVGSELRDFAQSQDLLQDLFVDILRDWEPGRFGTEEDFLRWARQIARNNVRGVARRRRVRLTDRLGTTLGALPPAEEPGPATQAGRTEERSLLERALKELPATDQRLIQLREVDQLPWAEIAARVDAPSPDAARLQHARILARITSLVERLRRRNDRPPEP